MTGTILILTCSYVAVAALLLNLNLSSSHSRLIKFISIILVTCLYAGAWHGSLNLLGWPSKGKLPEAFRVHWIFLDEPNKHTEEEGGIYFWIRHLDQDNFPIGDLRSFKMPWDRKMAEYEQTALEEIEGGTPINGFAARSEGTDEREGARGTGTPDADGPMLTNPEGEELAFEFRRALSPQLPPKGLPDL